MPPFYHHGHRRGYRYRYPYYYDRYYDPVVVSTPVVLSSDSSQSFQGSQVPPYYRPRFGMMFMMMLLIAVIVFLALRK
jgi:hypothetical protein